MEQRPLLVLALAAASVTAAGAGGYVATRQFSSAPASAVVESIPVNPIPVGPIPVGAGFPPASVDAAGTENEIEPPAAAAPPLVQRAPARAVAASPPRTTRPASPTPVRPAVRSSSPVAPARQPDAPAPSRTPGVDDNSTVDARAVSNRDAYPASRDDSWPSRVEPVSPGPSRPAETPTWSEPAAPVRRVETVTIPADSVIGVQLENSVSTATAKVEDPVRARVTRDVLAGGAVVIPAGSRVLGSVTLVDEGGKVRERARLGVRFHTLVLADGSEVQLPTETIYRDGESPARGSAAKIGGAAMGGAIIGAILGGGKGAAIGAAAGAGSGTAMTMAGKRQPAELRSGQPVTVRVSDAVTTQVER